MVKRTIQTSRPGHTIGIEHDHLAIRCARLSTDGRGGFAVERVEEFKGDFSEDTGLLEGYRNVKSIMGVSARDSVVACLAGKQVYAAQMEFRKLGSEEMEQALRLELRKTVHFEVATSTLDYEFLEEDGSSNGGMAQIMLALASNSLLNRELGLLERAGMRVSVVDLLPMAIANALWSFNGIKEGDSPLVGLHVGPQISTIVIDAEHYPFFNRNIYFAAEDVFGPNANPVDRDKRLQSLADEVSRSLVFYEKNSQTSGFQELQLLGDFLDGEDLQARLKKVSGLPVRKMNLSEKLGFTRDAVPGRFDLALALAARGEM
jgi:Tfp pilus assembly PilM family ATPase